MPRKKITDILQNDDALNEYIEELSEKIDINNEVEDKIDVILSNLLDTSKFDNFNNIRYLRSTYIDSVANLLKLKTEIPLKRAQTQKLLIDILSKKKDLELKEKAIANNDENAKSLNGSLRSLFEYLDKNNIHPSVDESILDNESIIDKGAEEEVDGEEETN